MTKEIEIQGCVSVPEEVSMDDFIDNFIAFIEENGWSFGGGYRTIIDGYYSMRMERRERVSLILE